MNDKTILKQVLIHYIHFATTHFRNLLSSCLFLLYGSETWSLILKGRTKIEGVWEEGAEDNTWTLQ
jgi:hypothetical protein